MEIKETKPYTFIICGKARNGKDTIGGFIKEYYENHNKKTINLQYSSYIKEYAKVISNWDGSEETKESVRSILQLVGTEIVRDNIDEDFFVKRLCDDIKVYSYFYDIFFTFEDIGNPCEYSAMLSFYPIPIFLGLIYVIRNRKDLHFWIPMLVVSLFLTVWCVWGFPALLANITMMSMTTASRVSIPLGTACIYMLIYLFANFDKEKDKLINKKLTYFLAGFSIIYIIYKAKTTIGLPYLDKFKILLGGEIFLVAIWGILNLNNEKIKNYTLYGLIFIALMSGLRVNPVIRSTDILYTKPVALKMQEIRNENPEAIWAVVDGTWWRNDYAVANGIRTINSTNVYPNLEMYETILGEQAEENRKIYNRYVHVILNITDEKSTVELMYADQVAINLNYNDLEKLNIEYILSTKDLSEEECSKIFEELYNEDGMYIYKVTKGN